MGLRALVFDFDGLILDTETPEVEAWQAIFERHGVDFPDDWWIHAIGRGAEQMTETPADVLERLCGRLVDREAIEAEYQGLRMANIYAKEVLPGVRELLSEAGEKGLEIGLASSSKHAWVDAHLDRLGLSSGFKAVLCADDVERAKPFPDLYLAACKALSVEPGQATALEDSPNGIRAAKEAGLRCVAVPNSLTRRLDLSLADVSLESLAGITVDSLVGMLSR